jgi:hypothetical protein
LTGETTLGLTNASGGHEGSSIALYKGKYLVAGSAVAGLDPSDTTYAIADAPLGPYTDKGLMSEKKTWSSQISAFVYLAETDRLFAMNEQWLLGPDGKRAPAEQSTQLWLPVAFDPATGVAKMEYTEAWDPWDGKPAPADAVALGGQAGQAGSGSNGGATGGGGGAGAGSSSSGVGGMLDAGPAAAGSSSGGGNGGTDAAAAATAPSSASCAVAHVAGPAWGALAPFLLATALRRRRRPRHLHRCQAHRNG